MSHANNKISVLIIDTSVECRELFSEVIKSSPEMELIATAPNGNIGYIKLHDLKPDVVLLDVNIQDFDLKQFTENALEIHKYCGIILTVNQSSKISRSNETIWALESGAFEIFEKPDKRCADHFNYVQRRLLIKIKEFSIKKYSKIAREVSLNIQPEERLKIVQQISKYSNKNKSQFQLIAIGVSTGGPRALTTIIPQLPANFPIPIIIVIHLPEIFTASLAEDLDRKTLLHVVEANDGDIIKRGKIYIARGGIHIKVKKKHEDTIIIYDNSPPVNNCKPSVDVLMESVAENYGSKAMGIILTGMGNDGATGMNALKNSGAITIAQDRETSVVWGMPNSAINLNCIDEVLPLQKIMLHVMRTI